MRVVIEPGSELGAIVRLPSDGAKPAPAPAPVVTGQLTPEEQAQPQYRALTRDDLIAAIRDGLSEEQVAEAHDRTVAQVRYTLGRHGLPDLTGKPRPHFEAPDPPLRAVPERRAVTPEAMRAAVSAHPEWTIDEHAAAFGLARGVFGDTLAALKISLTDLRRELALALTAATVGAVMREHPDWSEQRLARYWGMQAKTFRARLREADIDLAVLRREFGLPIAAPPEADPPGRDLSQFVAPLSELPPEAPTDIELEALAAKAGFGTLREFSETVTLVSLGEADAEAPQAFAASGLSIEVLLEHVRGRPEIKRHDLAQLVGLGSTAALDAVLKRLGTNLRDLKEQAAAATAATWNLSARDTMLEAAPAETPLERAVATGPDQYAEDRRRLAAWWLEHPTATMAEIGLFLGCGATSVNHWVLTRFHRFAGETRAALGLPQPRTANRGCASRKVAAAAALLAEEECGERYEMAGEWTREELGARLYHLRELVGVGHARVKARIVLELYL